MSGFTSEDFAGASFARHPGTGATACRVAGAKGGPAWTTEDLAETTDEDMARDGWVPVVESRVTEHTLRDSQEKAARKRQRLVDHIADQDRVIRRRNDEIAALRRELADAQAPLSLDTLAAAWEAAEVSDECNVGDVLISKRGRDDYNMYRADVESHALSASVRILSRATQREPHDDLTEVIREVWPTPEDHVDIGSLAYHLHERGVIVTKNAKE